MTTFTPVPKEERATFRKAGDVLGSLKCGRCGMTASNVVHDVDPRDREWAENSGYYTFPLHEFEHPAEEVMQAVQWARETRWRINESRRVEGYTP